MGAETYPPNPITQSAPLTIFSDRVRACPNLSGAERADIEMERGRVTLGIAVSL